MATYLTLNTLFSLVVIILLGRRLMLVPKKPLVTTLLFLLLLTAIFDNVIVGVGVVAYDTSKLLGAYVGYAPVEDFMYAILAVILVPTIWHMAGGAHEK